MFAVYVSFPFLVMRIEPKASSNGAWFDLNVMSSGLNKVDEMHFHFNLITVIRKTAEGVEAFRPTLTLTFPNL